MDACADPLEWLRANGAQRDVIDGVRGLVEATPTGESRWRRLWETCPRGDWLLGIASRLGVEHRVLARAAVGCARTSLDLAAGPEAEQVLATCEAWIARHAEEGAVRDATERLERATARATSPAEDAAMRAALAVGMGIVEERDALASAAACATEALIFATLDCGMDVVMGYAHQKCADAVRAAIPWSEVEARARVAGDAAKG